MKIITNYLGLNLLKGIFLVTILLLGIDLFFYFINELRFVGTGNYTFVAACEFVVLTIPRKIYLTSPWSALIGSLLVLGSMAQNSELLFMQTIGLSANRIANYAGSYIVLFTILIFVLGELFAPKIELFAQNKKTLALSKGNTIYTQYGTWIKNQNQFIHIEQVQDNNILYNITIYQFDNRLKLEQTILAKKANLIAANKNLWKLHNVTITDFSTKKNKITVNNLADIEKTNLLDINILQTINIKHLERLSIKKLFEVSKDRVKNNLTVTDYNIALWKKIMHPFSILIMSYLAIPFVLGPLRSCNRGLRLLIGVVLGASFYLLNALFLPLVTVINFPASLAAIIPPIIFLLLGVFLSKKA